MTANLVVGFADSDCLAKGVVGGKAVGLAEMTQAGMPVAPGFAVVARAYREFLNSGSLRDQVEAELAVLADSDESALSTVGDRLTRLLEAVELPDDVANHIRAAYEDLCASAGVPNVAVAVRSSATAEDSVGASFAGEFETWVDVVGAESVLDHVRKCYASVYSGRVLSYLRERGIDPHAIEMAVVVQKVVRARAAGVMFTLSPITGDRSKISIEASWGLGLSVVGGEVTPDRFLVDKIGLSLGERALGDKQIEYRRGDLPTAVPADRQSEFCLSDAEVVAVATFGKQLERMHGQAQDIEFAIDEELPDGSRIVLLQCRPETVWSKVQRKPAFDANENVMSWISGSISGALANTTGAVGPTDAHPHG